MSSEILKNLLLEDKKLREENKKLREENKQKLIEKLRKRIEKRKKENEKLRQVNSKLVSKPKPKPKPKPKIKTFDEYFQECIKNKTIPKDTPPYFKKALERAMKEYDNGIKLEKFSS